MKIILFLISCFMFISAVPDLRQSSEHSPCNISEFLTDPFCDEMEVVHDFHLSKCIIEYAHEEQSFQIMLLMFIDDLELALAERGEKGLKLCTDHESEKGEALIFEYLQNTFKFSVNNKETEFDFIGKEASEDYLGVWVYLEIPNISDIQNVGINCSILTEMFDDQQNIIQLKLPGGKRGFFTLDKDKKSDSITL